MKSLWQFECDAKLDDFCRGIVAEMIAVFCIPEAEAVGRVNRHLRGYDLRDEYAWRLYHENEKHWAYGIYLRTYAVDFFR